MFEVAHLLPDILPALKVVVPCYQVSIEGFGLSADSNGITTDSNDLVIAYYRKMKICQDMGTH